MKHIVKAVATIVLIVAICKIGDYFNGAGVCNPVTGEAAKIVFVKK